MQTLGQFMSIIRNRSGKSYKELSEHFDTIPQEFLCYERDLVIPSAGHLSLILTYLKATDAEISTASTLRGVPFIGDQKIKNAIQLLNTNKVAV